MKYIILPTFRIIYYGTFALLNYLIATPLVFTIILLWTFSIKRAIEEVKEDAFYTHTVFIHDTPAWWYRTFYDMLIDNKELNKDYWRNQNR